MGGVIVLHVLLWVVLILAAFGTQLIVLWLIGRMVIDWARRRRWEKVIEREARELRRGWDA